MKKLRFFIAALLVLFVSSAIYGQAWDQSLGIFRAYRNTYTNLYVDSLFSYTGDTIYVASPLKRSVAAGITATNPGVQGDNALTEEINEISTVGADDDAVTLPAATAGLVIVTINNGANQLEIWPASGDNAGNGVDTAVFLTAGSNATFVAYNTTNWESVPGIIAP